MKNFSEKVKDIFYNISDYLIIFTIIIGIGLIITWRLDILFPKNLTDIESNRSVEKESTESKMIEKAELGPKDSKDDQVKDPDPKDTVTEDKDLKAKDVEEVKKEEIKTIKVSIPEDSNPNNIAEILLANKLIKDAKEFEAALEKLDLKQELPTGEYEIKENASLEEIEKILVYKE